MSSSNAPFLEQAAIVDAARILWDEVPALPLFVQPRTTVVADKLRAVVPNGSSAGLGWNMDRWVLIA